MSRSKSLIFFIASMVIFGTNGLIVANISLGSAEIVLMRTFLGSLFLLAIVLVKRSFSFADLKADLVPATMGGAALGLNWVLLFSAYRSAGVGLSTLTYYCGPIIVLALSPVLFREKLTWNKLLAIAAVAVGMFCITGDIEPGSDVQTGILFGGGAALLYASLIVANKRVKRLSGLNCAMYELIVAFFVVLIYLVASNVKLPVIPAAEDIVWVLVIGLVNTGLAYYLYFSSLQKLPGQTVALVCYIDPLTALLVSGAFLGEKLFAVQIAGAVLILGGACLGELKFKKTENKK
ncbi:MAG: EamA family transporter [Oscillospiraceae bacterium]|nr:EamA family transporter [Oscillospiraceae bacterium]